MYFHIFTTLALTSFIKLTTSYFANQCSTPPGKLVLTFDVKGPFNNPEVLDVLQKHKIPAIFFLPSENVKANPKWIDTLVKNDYEIGRFYDNFEQVKAIFNTKVDESSTLDKLNSNDVPLEKVKLIRLPREKEIKDINSIVKHSGFLAIDSNLNVNNNIDSIQKLISRFDSKEQSFILPSISLSQLDKVKLDRLIKSTSEKGFQFVSLSECLDLKVKTLSKSKLLRRDIDVIDTYNTEFMKPRYNHLITGLVGQSDNNVKASCPVYIPGLLFSVRVPC